MTEDVQLRKDNEVLYDFSEEWFDGTQLLDKGPNRFHAVANGGVNIDRDSPIGESAKFDGVDDFFEADYPSELTFGGGSVTFGLYLQVGEEDDAPRVMTIGNETGGVHNIYRLLFDSNEDLDFQVQDGTDSASSGEYRLETSNWYMVCGVLDRFNDRIKLYVDGELVASGDASAIGSIDASTYGLHIGSGSNDSSYFDGNVAFAGVWSRALNESEIEALSRMKGAMVQQL